MLALQEHTRGLVNGGLDCSEPSQRLLAMRAAMVDLIAQRNAMGGSEACPTVAERLKQNHRPKWPRRVMPAKEKPGRGRALSM